MFTCKKTGAGDFTRAHCAAADAGSGEYSHVSVAEGTTTEITGTSEDTEGKPTVSKLKSTQSGVNEELQSPLAHILAENAGEKSWLTNAKDPTTGEHYVHGEAWVQYTEVKVTAPAEKGCKVKTGQVTTKKLKFTSKGQGDNILFEPVTGTVFAEFEVESCTGSAAIEALNGLYKVEGSLKAQPDGATLITTHTAVTTQGTLKLRGQKAGLEGSVTVKATDKAAGDEVDTPLSVTTVETP